MSILDDAIREHLQLKRAHGADAAELKRLEDEAFGPPGRPDEADSFSEGPTEFLAAPSADAAEAKAEATEREAPNITDLQEAPEPPKGEPVAEEEPAEEPSPSGEHETVPVPRPESGPTTDERQAIAEQPTEFFDVEEEIGAPSEQPSPTDEQLLDSQLSEPRLAPAEPPAPHAEVVDNPPSEDEDDFFSEQRLSDELNQALEAPVTDEHEALPEPEPPSEEHTEVYDVQRERSEEYDEQDEDGDDDQREDEREEPPANEREDVLDDTPDFLEDAPEDDELWFEQKPPKDFDFDD
jgi:hypothetical protein